MKKHRRFLWFLFGLGSQLQLFGTSLCFTELFVYGAAIVLFTSEWPYMRRNGVTTFFWLSIGVVANGTLSCLYNHTPFFGVIRGMAVITLLPCAIIVCHWMLRKDMANFKWYLVGLALSVFVSTFFFQNAVETATLSHLNKKDVTDAIMDGPLWWIRQVTSLTMTIPKGWYLQCPTFLAAILPLVLSAYALFSSVSGRSAALGAIGTTLFVLLGNKKQDLIRRRICKRFWLLCCIGIVSVIVFKGFYKYAASTGLLGEEARHKYEVQTRGGESIGALLLGGRMDSFCGLIACVDRPLVGFGPWAPDTSGYVGEFIKRYGVAEDYEEYIKSMSRGDYGLGLIPAHSHITEFWLWYGIMGLMFWLYVVYALLRYLREDCYIVPQWYMWLAASAPSFLWGIFFSPFSARVGTIMFVVAILMVRAVRRGVQQLPQDMIKEIQSLERR